MTRSFLILATLIFAGCFEPLYADGGFACGTAGACPGGQACSQGRCWTHVPAPEAPDAGQGGEPEVTRPVRQLYQPCDVFNRGTPARFDDCGAGLVCAEGVAGGRCLQLCATTDECGGLGCDERDLGDPLPVAKPVCGLPEADCDPTQPGTCPAGICYLESGRSTCELTGGEGQQVSCLHSRECLPGWTCPTSGPRTGTCAPTCDQESPVCPQPGQSCFPQGDRWGYCL